VNSSEPSICSVSVSEYASEATADVLSSHDLCCRLRFPGTQYCFQCCFDACYMHSRVRKVYLGTVQELLLLIIFEPLSSFIAVAAVVTATFASIRTLDKISWLGQLTILWTIQQLVDILFFVGWVGLVSIVVAIMTTVISVGLTERPAAAPQTGPFHIDRVAINNPTFVDAFVSLVNIVFAFCELVPGWLYP
jgi:hypothetical protein